MRQFKWWVLRVRGGSALGRWRAYSPRDWLDDSDSFPSWREAYEYAHTHPNNRKETAT